MKTQKIINRLVEKYPWRDSEELFRNELKHLVQQALKEDIKKKHKHKWQFVEYSHYLDGMFRYHFVCECGKTKHVKEK